VPTLRSTERDTLTTWRWVLLLTALLAHAELITAQVNAIPTRGKRFWTGFMQNGFGAQSLKVHILPTVATTGTVSVPLTGWSTTFSVGANGVAVIDVPLSAENTGSETIQNKGVLIQSNDSVNVFISSFQNYTHDLTQVLPEGSIGTSYRVDAYSGLPNFNNLHRSELLIIAVEDGTQVRITPTATTTGGHPAGAPFTVDLNAGQSYQVQAQTDVADLTGTLVEGTDLSGPCRPFVVIGGSMCAGVPGGCSACDVVFEQLLPRTFWGSRFHTVPVNGTTAVTYRILADQDGTTVSIGGGAPFILNAGQRHEVNGTNVPVCIQADGPVSVAQLLEGYGCAGNGDPSLFILSPHDRLSRSATFHTSTSNQINQHSVSVIMPTGTSAPLLLNGNPVSPALFQAYPGCTDRVWAKIPVSTGVNRLQSTVGFQAYMFGIGFGESYAASVNDIGSPSVTQDSVICSTGPVTLTAPAGLVNIQWTNADDPTTIMGTGPSLLVSPTGSTNYVVQGTQASSGCPRTFTYHVGAPVPQQTQVLANGTSTVSVCQYTPVPLSITPLPDPSWFDVQWSPTTGLDNSGSATATATPSTTTWYRATITSTAGCGSFMDSVLVQVQPGTILDLSTTAQPAQLCEGNSTQLGSSVLRTLGQDQFNSANGPLWFTVQGGSISSACGSTSGTALYFNGAGQRLVQTLPLNTTGGGQVRFALKIANGSAPCDDAETGEDVVLEYSTNNGISWSAMASYTESAYPNFTPIIATIPAPAQGANVSFRLRQLANSGAGQDNWAVDDFLVARYDNAYATYTWSPAASLTNASIAAPTATPTNTGWYILNAMDPSGGCVYRDSVLVTVAPAVQLSVTPDVTLCNGGSTQLTASSTTPGTTFQWTPANGSLSATNIAAPLATPTTTTAYTVTATSPSGCSASATITVTVGTLSNLTVTAAPTTLCQGQSTTLNALITGSGDMTISWSGAGLNSSTIANPTASPVQTTTYTCTVTHTASGCSRTASITITVNGGYTANAGPDLTLCSTQGHQLTVQHNVPNASFSWTPAGNLNAAAIAAPTIMANTTATYTVTVSDLAGCSVTDQVTISRAFDGLPATQNIAVCADVPPMLQAPTTAASYLWSTGATTPSITPSIGGVYTLTMTDVQGCQATVTFNVQLLALPLIDLGPDQTICGNDAITLNAGTGNSYAWTTGATGQSVQVSSSGMYGVTVTNANGCAASDAVNITFAQPPSDPLTDLTACASDPVVLSAANAGSTYLWSTGSTAQTITVTQSGTYSVTVTTPANCSATFDAVVNLLPELTVDLGPDTSLCAGASLLLDATQPLVSHGWSTGATTPTITVGPGSYQVTLSNGACTASDAITIGSVPSPTDALTDITICADQPPVLNAGNAGSTYLWSTGATGSTIIADASGQYTVTVTTPEGCASTFDAQVQLIMPPTLDLGPDTVLCEGQRLDLVATHPGSTYSWSNGATSPTVQVSTAGTYSVTVNNGCIRTDAITVAFNPSPARMAVNEFHTCLDDAPRYVVLDAGNPGSGYDWSTGATTQVIMASAYGWYYVNIRNAYDCSVRDSAQVIEYCPATIFIPNTFTPNGDGLNDVFIPVGKSIASIRLMIFDRWGEALYETTDMDMGWDGTYRGEVVKNDMYVWRLTYKFYTDEHGTIGMEQQQMGQVQVLR
jgi:gliding motility-associated-like protein